MIEPPDLKFLDSAAKDALILALIERVNALTAENAELKRRLARLEAKLGEPPKTPSNSSLPPSQGRKASGEASSKPKGKPHPGAGSRIPIRPHPRRARQGMPALRRRRVGGGADRARTLRLHRVARDQAGCDARVVLHGGVCSCCSARFKAPPPEGFEPGSPFGPNLRAFAIYLRVAHAVSFERLSRLMSDLVRFAAQMGRAKKDDQVCIAHLIREATYAVEAGDLTFAPAPCKLLKRACGIARRRPELADAMLRAYAYSLTAKLDALLRSETQKSGRCRPRNASTASLPRLGRMRKQQSWPSWNTQVQLDPDPCGRRQAQAGDHGLPACGAWPPRRPNWHRDTFLELGTLNASHKRRRAPRWSGRIYGAVPYDFEACLRRQSGDSGARRREEMVTFMAFT